MAELIVKQLHSKRSLDRTLENFKKIGRNNLTPVKVNLRITRLKELWEQFRDGHYEMLKVVPEDMQKSNEYFNAGCFEMAEDSFDEALSFMEDALSDLELSVSAHGSKAFAKPSSLASSVSLAHLPSISLPPFDGKPHEWEQFRDQFQALIIESDVTNVARMHYLVSCLRGSALDCIRNLPITNDSLAWRALIAWFENKRRVLDAHMSTLLSLTALPVESANGLQALQDKVRVAISSLNRLGRSSGDLWNNLLVHLVVHKLDPTMRKAWSLKIGETTDFPSFEALSAFLANRARTLTELSRSLITRAVPTGALRRVNVATAAASVKSGCEICKARHSFRDCPTFTRGSPTLHRDLVKKHRRCFNCLGSSHTVIDCPSKHSCRTCGSRHHSMLHLQSDFGAPATGSASGDGDSAAPAGMASGIQALHSIAAAQTSVQVLLSTALVTVRVPSGRTAVVRALLDSGSQVTFLTERLAQSLHVKRTRLPVAISALGGATAVPAGTVLSATRVCVSPRESLAPSCSVSCIILKTLTAYAPKPVTTLASYPHLRDLSFADPTPASSDPIDLILGADAYNEVILDGRRKGQIHEPTAQNSIFSWVLSGPVQSAALRLSVLVSISGADGRSLNVSVHQCTASPSLDAALRQFWEIEELPQRSILTLDEEKCEQHFRDTHSRAADGRYTVRLPFRHAPPIDIGSSRPQAERQLRALCYRLRAQPVVSGEYNAFLSEYEQLGHMRRVAAPGRGQSQAVYIPHHAVFRHDSITTKLRVVFNASAVTSNGTSLNDHLFCGAKLQTNLSTVITKWRMFRFVYSSDIAKMYRQIRVDSRDRDYQRILWRPDGNADVGDYQLQTVTYGMTCAPFLALRVLQQLGDDEGSSFPLALPVLREHIYVDDVLFGSDSIKQLRETRDELVSLLRRGGFELRKWASNSPLLLADIDEANHGLACSKDLASEETMKVLGVRWSPSLDVFLISVSLAEKTPSTKRSVLSLIARIYDPLGWLTPTTIAAKVVMQQLWKESLGWDDPLPVGLFERWMAIYSSFPSLSSIRIPRWIGLGSGCRLTELHGFSDVSTRAYAAVVYLKVVTADGEVSISLVAGKSRVAPL